MVNDTWLENVAPPTAYLDELTPNIRTTVVDGNTQMNILFCPILKILQNFQYILMETQLYLLINAQYSLVIADNR